MTDVLTVRAFSVHSTDWLKQTPTFVKFKLFQDQRFENHAAKKCAGIDFKPAC